MRERATQAQPAASDAAAKVVLLGGAAGVGKSTVCRLLARDSRIVALDKDEVAGAVCEALLVALGRPRADRDSDTYLRLVRPVEYQLLEDALLGCAAAGAHVVADAPWTREFTDHAWVARMRERAAARGATVTVAWVRCDPAENRQRLSCRGCARDTGKLSDWDAYLHGPGQWLTRAPDTADLVLDSTDRSPCQLARQLRAAAGLP